MLRALPLAVLCLLCARPAAAEESYILTFTFARGAQTRRFSQNVRLGESYNAVWSASDPALRHFIVNAMPVASDEEGRVELMYQVEWDEGGAVLQAQDSAKLALREDAVLSSLDGDWTIAAKVSPGTDRDSCARPAGGGGLLVALRGPGVLLTRRTMALQQSNVLYDAGPKGFLSLSLLPRPLEDGGYGVEYRVGRDSGAVEGSASDVVVKAGVETPLPGTGLTLTVSDNPRSERGEFSVREVPEGQLLRHAGRPVSFLHPKGWQVMSYCDAPSAVKSWRMVDESLPEDRRQYDVAWGYVVKEGTQSYKERAPVGAAELPAKGGRCVLWSLPGRDSAACDLKGGLRVDFHLDGPSEARSVHFKRLVSSLRAE